MKEETVTLSNSILQVRGGKTTTRAGHRIYYERFVYSNYLSIYSKIQICQILKLKATETHQKCVNSNEVDKDNTVFRKVYGESLNDLKISRTLEKNSPADFSCFQ
jgi:hypothetical protein